MSWYDPSGTVSLSARLVVPRERYRPLGARWMVCLCCGGRLSSTNARAMAAVHERGRVHRVAACVAWSEPCGLCHSCGWNPCRGSCEPCPQPCPNTAEVP